MKLFRAIFDAARRPRAGERWPQEFSSTLFLKLQSRQRLGGLALTHYVTNPEERPDHVLRHDCRFRTFTQGDFESTRWAVVKITPAEQAMLERQPGDSWQSHLVVLTDAGGTRRSGWACGRGGAMRALNGLRSGGRLDRVERVAR